MPPTLTSRDLLTRAPPATQPASRRKCFPRTFPPTRQHPEPEESPQDTVLEGAPKGHLLEPGRQRQDQLAIVDSSPEPSVDVAVVVESTKDGTRAADPSPAVDLGKKIHRCADRRHRNSDTDTHLPGESPARTAVAETGEGLAEPTADRHGNPVDAARTAADELAARRHDREPQRKGRRFSEPKSDSIL